MRSGLQAGKHTKFQDVCLSVCLFCVRARVSLCIKEGEEETHTHTHTYARTHTYVTHARTQTHTHTHLLGCANRLQTVETILPTNNRKGVAEDDPKQFSVERGTKTQGCKNNLVIWLEKMGDVKSTACHSFANIEQLHPFTDRSIVTRGKTGTLLY